MASQRYQNYFKNHYKSRFSVSDIVQYQQWFSSQLQQFAGFLKFDANTQILELGSGSGGFFNLIKDQIEIKNYLGLELDPAAVKFANRYFKTDRFKLSSYEQLKSQKRFDYIFGFEVLEHLEDPLLVIQKMAKDLKPGGLFIGTSPYPYLRNVESDRTHLFVLHPENWRRLFVDNGFEIIELKPMSFLPGLWRISQFLNICLPFYLPLPKTVSTSLIVAKKRAVR